jgi:hypothetical protein
VDGRREPIRALYVGERLCGWGLRLAPAFDGSTAVTRSIFRRLANGRRKVVGRHTSRVCRIPRYVSSSLTMVFSTG